MDLLCMRLFGSAQSYWRKLLPTLRRENGRRHAGARRRVAGNDMNIKQMKFRKIAENTQLKEEEQ